MPHATYPRQRPTGRTEHAIEKKKAASPAGPYYFPKRKLQDQKTAVPSGGLQPTWASHPGIVPRFRRVKGAVGDGRWV